jgi:CheY-like chemotaxis protein
MEQNLEHRKEDAPEIESWHLELESALRPFPRFVTDVYTAVSDLETHQTQMIASFEARLQELEGQLAQAKAVPAVAPKKPNPSTSKTPARTLEQRRVLLIDDAELSRVLMSHYFKGLPVKVDFALSLQDAIRSCGEKKYDLLIVDLELKGVEAVELAGILKSHGRLMALGSGESQSAEQATAIQCGFDLYLPRSTPKEAMIEGLSVALWGSF